MTYASVNENHAHSNYEWWIPIRFGQLDSPEILTLQSEDTSKFLNGFAAQRDGGITLITGKTVVENDTYKANLAEERDYLPSEGKLK